MTLSAKRRKTTAVALIVAAAVVVAAGLGLGLGLGLKDRAPEVPKAEIALTGEPSYTIVFSWQSVNADKYILEYEYSEYLPGEIKSVETTELSVRIERIKGLLKYRLTAVKGDDSSSGEWLTYTVPALELPSMQPFEVNDSGNGVLTVDRSTLKAVTYRFRGEEKTVANYEIGVAAPGEDGVPETVSILWSDLEGWSFSVNKGGVWKIYIRPVFFIGIGSAEVYDEEMDKLYSRFAPFTVISVTVAQ